MRARPAAQACASRPRRWRRSRWEWPPPSCSPAGAGCARRAPRCWRTRSRWGLRPQTPLRADRRRFRWGLPDPRRERQPDRGRRSPATGPLLGRHRDPARPDLRSAHRRGHGARRSGRARSGRAARARDPLVGVAVAVRRRPLRDDGDGDGLLPLVGARRRALRPAARERIRRRERACFGRAHRAARGPVVDHPGALAGGAHPGYPRRHGGRRGAGRFTLRPVEPLEPAPPPVQPRRGRPEARHPSRPRSRSATGPASSPRASSRSS